jgi:Zn-dependent oligopeptidase
LTQIWNELHQIIDEIEQNPEPANFHNTILPLDTFFHKFYTARFVCLAHIRARNHDQAEYFFNCLSRAVGFANHQEIYSRILSVLSTMEEGTEDHRFAVACKEYFQDFAAARIGGDEVEFNRRMNERTKARKNLIQEYKKKKFWGGVDEKRRTALIRELVEAQSAFCMTDAEGGEYSIRSSYRYNPAAVEKVKHLLRSISDLYQDLGLDRLSLKNVSSLGEGRYSLHQLLHDGIFFMAKEPYGLTAVERADIRSLREDVKVFELLEADGSKLGLVFFDLHQPPIEDVAKDVTQSGWCTSLLNRSRNLNQQRAAAIVTMYLAKNEDKLSIRQAANFVSRVWARSSLSVLEPKVFVDECMY